MKYLLDTMVWLWSVGPAERIGSMGLEVLSSAAEEVYLSAVSSLEIAIKAKLGKFRLPDIPGRYVPKRLAEQTIRPLSVTQEHSLKVYDLPMHHRDPFDRLIVAQAIIEEMTILTSDQTFGKYPVNVVWCGT
ncbi:MAG: type II toxin-antitoxin system VapC family toxin [Terriglobales bacterium]